MDLTGFPGKEALDLTLLISGCDADSLAEARRFGAASGAWGEAGAGRDDRRAMAVFIIGRPESLVEYCRCSWFSLLRSAVSVAELSSGGVCCRSRYLLGCLWLPTIVE